VEVFTVARLDTHLAVLHLEDAHVLALFLAVEVVLLDATSTQSMQPSQREMLKAKP
jgi:hypothetical protein